MKIFLAIIAYFGFMTTVGVVIVGTSTKLILKEIEYETEGELTKTGDEMTITIKDYDESEFDVQFQGNDVISFSGPDENGVITATALADNGSGSIFVTAKNRKDLEISLTITEEEVVISATYDDTELWIGETTTFRILNIDDLINPRITNVYPDKIDISNVNNQAGTATVTAKAPISGVIQVEADNAVAGLFIVAIRFNLVITTDPDSLGNLQVGQNIVLKVGNYEYLVQYNFQIYPDPSPELTGEIEVQTGENRGEFKIFGRKAGNTKLILTVDHETNDLVLPCLVYD